MVPIPSRSESITNPLPNSQTLIRFRSAAMAEKSNRRANSINSKRTMCTGIRRLHLGEKDYRVVGLAAENDDSDHSYEGDTMTPPPMYEDQSPAYEEMDIKSLSLISRPHSATD